MTWIRSLLITFICILGFSSAAEKPNVLFITIDDLNDWIGCLGGHPQSQTPNIDALAKRGILFTNAHCNAPICNPSRVSFMSGIRPSTSGIYLNTQDYKAKGASTRDAMMLPECFASQGYSTMGCGKVFHTAKGRQHFDNYGPAGGQGPFPPARINCPKEASPTPLWDWGVFPKEEGPEYNDIADAAWTADQLGKKHDKPLFLACGFYRPHVPLFAPQRYFDLHPYEQVKLPTVLENDRGDIPDYAFKIAASKYSPSHEWFVKNDKWKQAVQSYMACVSFTDDNVGKLVKALDAGPSADSTWIVLFSDHGFFLGEKQHWAKQSLWERATKVPLIVVPPRNRAQEFAIGEQCHKPVELLSIYPTLLEACGLKAPEDQLEGHSIIPLLKDPDVEWPYCAITTHTASSQASQNEPHKYTTFASASHAVRDDRYRYIRYADGSEELYDLKADPREWENISGEESSAEIITRLSSFLPAPAE